MTRSSSSVSLLKHTGHWTQALTQLVPSDYSGPTGSIRDHLAMGKMPSWLEVTAGGDTLVGPRKGELGSKRRSGPGHSTLELAAGKHQGSQGTRAAPHPLCQPRAGSPRLCPAQCWTQCLVQAEKERNCSLGGVGEGHHTGISEKPKTCIKRGNCCCGTLRSLLVTTEERMLS